MAESDGDRGGSVIRNWGALALAAGAMFWTVASQWGGRDALVSATLDGLHSRLGQQAARIGELHARIDSGDRSMLNHMEVIEKSIRAAEISILQLDARLNIYGEERSRVIGGINSAQARVQMQLDELRRELQVLHDRVIGSGNRR